MFTIRELKKNARGTLRRNYFGIVLTCLIVTVLMGTFINPMSTLDDILSSFLKTADSAVTENVPPRIAETVTVLSAPDSSDILEEFLENVGAGNTTSSHWTEGVLSVFANATEGAGNFVVGVLNVINQFVFKDKIGNGIIIAVGILLSAAVYFLFISVLLVGLYRYLLENRRYSKTPLVRILFPWTIRRGARIAWIMFVKRVYVTLWWFTVVGGVIKHYSYKMVPMIIAENPDMTANEAITLSRQMMDGYKWKNFLLDMSFIVWFILNLFTLSLLSVFLITPYRYAAETELYMKLREKAKENKLPSSEKLCDTLLEADLTAGIYPAEQYLITPAPGRKWIQSDYNRSYSVTSLILMFFSFSFIGYVWEVVLFLFTTGEFVNRGTTYGPWLPIYGFGGVMILVLLKKFRDKPAILFLLTMVISGTMEYVTSWFLEVTRGMRWWDYSGYFLNINGRICLEGLLVFALAGCGVVYLIAPALDNLYAKIPKKIKITICVVLITLFTADLVYTHFYPHVGTGITDNGITK